MTSKCLTPYYFALTHALMQSHFQTAKLLCTYKVNVNCSFRYEGWQTPLSLMTLANNANMVGFLIAHGASIDSDDDNVTPPLLTALTLKSPHCLARLLSVPVNWDKIKPLSSTSLSDLVQPSFHEHLELLLNAHYPPDRTSAKGQTLLFKAVLHCQIQAVTKLITKGADVNLAVTVNIDVFRKSLKIATDHDTVLRFKQFCKVHKNGKYISLSPLKLAEIINHDDLLTALKSSMYRDKTLRRISH